MARLATAEPHRIAPQSLFYRDSKWLRKQEKRLGKGRQGHGKKLRPWRWETWLARFPDGNNLAWTTNAADSRYWADVSGKMATWRESARF